MHCAEDVGLEWQIIGDGRTRDVLQYDVIQRPDWISDDTWDVVDWTMKIALQSDAVPVLLQPTSPFRTPQLVWACVRAYSISGAQRSFYHSYVRGPDNILTASGAVYVGTGIPVPAVHDPDPFDIDTEDDFLHAEEEWRKRGLK